MSIDDIPAETLAVYVETLAEDLHQQAEVRVDDIELDGYRGTGSAAVLLKLARIHRTTDEAIGKIAGMAELLASNQRRAA